MKIQANVTEFLHIYQNLSCEVFYEDYLITGVTDYGDYISVQQKDKKSIIFIKNYKTHEFLVVISKKMPRIEEFSVLGGK